MKNVYKKLLKIKKPVLIEVETSYGSPFFPRYRILYPNGKCEYDLIRGGGRFTKSCFSTDSVEKTVRLMDEYDKGFLKIVKIQEIK